MNPNYGILLEDGADREIIVTEYDAIDGDHQCLDCCAHFPAST